MASLGCYELNAMTVFLWLRKNFLNWLLFYRVGLSEISCNVSIGIFSSFVRIQQKLGKELEIIVISKLFAKYETIIEKIIVYGRLKYGIKQKICHSRS